MAADLVSLRFEHKH